jgi:hypothetical protein
VSICDFINHTIRRRVLLSCILLFATCCVKLYPAWQPQLFNDSFQYLSVAENSLYGRIGETSLIHWDEDRSFAHIPTPMTNFPIGYPILISGIQSLGITGESAGLIISLASSIGSIFLLELLCRRMLLPPRYRAAVLLAFSSSSATVTFATVVLSEAAFTLSILVGLTLTMYVIDWGDRQSEADERKRVAFAIAAGIAFGLSYWFRYAGLFFIVGLLLWISIELVISRPAKFHSKKNIIIVVAISSCLVLIGLLRNQILVGSWRGGNNKYVHHDLSELAHDYAIAAFELIFGPGDVSYDLIRIIRLLLGLSLLLASAISIVFLFRAPESVTLRFSRLAGSPVGLFTILIFTYVVCLAYAASRTGIDRNFRYFFPIFPPILALGALFVYSNTTSDKNSVGWKVWMGSWIASLIFFSILNFSISLSIQNSLNLDSTRSDLDRKIGRWPSLYALINSKTTTDDVIMANNGQAIGYFTHRKMVSFIGTKNSRILWTDVVVRENMSRYKAKLLIIHKRRDEYSSLKIQTAFLHQLSNAQSPGWLRLLAASDTFVVYETD